MTVNTQKKEAPRPVQDWENVEAKGHALCTEYVFREHIEGTRDLRDRQSAYLDSLPSDPLEAIRAALNLMHPADNEYA